MTAALQFNHSLLGCNTLGLRALVDVYIEITDQQQLPELLMDAETRQWPVTILGGGSNVVLRDNLRGLLIHIANRGITVQESTECVRVTAAAGESWHGLVMHCVDHGWWGIENLALIPGTVGAAPVQNIGAYGVELASVLESVTVWDRTLRQWRELNVEDCGFAYRDSVFKHTDRHIVCSVTLRLCRNGTPRVDYAALRAYLAAEGLTSPTQRQVAAAVIALRKSKLPDPALLPNVGSFFKNPVVSRSEFVRLQRGYPDIVHYPQEDGSVKLAAGWLLEQAGWKGRREGDVGMHAQQSLVLVNYGHATGEEVLQFASTVQQQIQSQFGVNLDIEPVVLP